MRIPRKSSMPGQVRRHSRKAAASPTAPEPLPRRHGATGGGIPQYPKRRALAAHSRAQAEGPQKHPHCGEPHPRGPAQAVQNWDESENQVAQAGSPLPAPWIFTSGMPQSTQLAPSLMAMATQKQFDRQVRPSHRLQHAGKGAAHSGGQGCQLPAVPEHRAMAAVDSPSP